MYKHFLYKNVTFKVNAKNVVLCKYIIENYYISSCRFMIIFVVDCRKLLTVADVD